MLLFSFLHEKTELKKKKKLDNLNKAKSFILYLVYHIVADWVSSWFNSNITVHGAYLCSMQEGAQSR